MEYTNKTKYPKTVVFIYGIPASGKLTVAKELAKTTGFKLVHNHLILDMIYKLFGWESFEGQRIRERLYFDITKSLILEEKNIIFTHVYMPNFVHSSGLSDKQFIYEIRTISEKNGYIFYPIQLICEKKELLNRVVNSSRSLNVKINTKKEMKKWFLYDDFSIPIESQFNLIINNTNLSPKRVSQIIIKNLLLKAL